MRKYLAVLLALFCFVLNGATGRFSHVVTVVSGTPVQVSTTSVMVTRSMVQMLHGGTSVGYICVVALGVTPHSKCSTDGELAGELNAASSTNPGGAWSDPLYLSSDVPVDLRTVWIDGDHSGDTVLVTGWRQR